MKLINPITLLLGLTLIAIIAIWFFFFKIRSKKAKGFDVTNELDKDLLKTNKDASILRNVAYVMQAAFFIVSVFTYSMITFGIEPKQEEEVFIPPSDSDDGEIIDEIPDTEPPPPPPPKVPVVQVIKVVDVVVDTPEIPKDTVPDDTGFDDDDGLEDDDDDDDVTTGTEEKNEVPAFEPAYFEGGEVEMSRTFQALLSDHLESYNPGKYFYLFSFTINPDGSLSNVKLKVASPNATPEMRAQAQAAIEKLPGWVPAKKKGMAISAEIKKKFGYTIQ